MNCAHGNRMERNERKWNHGDGSETLHFRCFRPYHFHFTQCRIHVQVIIGSFMHFFKQSTVTLLLLGLFNILGNFNFSVFFFQMYLLRQRHFALKVVLEWYLLFSLLAAAESKWPCPTVIMRFSQPPWCEQMGKPNQASFTSFNKTKCICGTTYS